MNDLVIFDLETTGLEQGKDHIIQVSALKISHETGDITGEFNSYVQPQGNYQIHLIAFLKTKITPEFLHDKPYWTEVGPEFVKFIEGCDLITYNGNNFDIPFLTVELRDIGITIDIMGRKCYDVFLEEKRRFSGKLSETYKRYMGKTMEENGLTAHDSMADVKATLEIFKAQRKIAKYGPEKMITDDNFLTDTCKEYPGHLCFNKGKYNEYPVKLIQKFDAGYIDWVLTKSNASDMTKKLIRNAW